MTDLKNAVGEFLGLKRIAVAGVSRNGREAANAIFSKLRSAGYEVFAVNPQASEVAGEPCYPDIQAIPGGVDGVVISTPPAAALGIVEECRAAGIGYVWMHRSFGGGSVSDEATERCRAAGISVIPGGCPMMFCEPVDFGHKCMRWILKVSGGLPQPVQATGNHAIRK